jgi:Cdc6-like AAA superfamily ATPase
MRQELALQPPELAGRNKLLKDAAIDMDRVLDRRPTKGMMLLGFRGVGKTVLLNRLHSMARTKGPPNGQSRGSGGRYAASAPYP